MDTTPRSPVFATRPGAPPKRGLLSRSRNWTTRSADIRQGSSTRFGRFDVAGAEFSAWTAFAGSVFHQTADFTGARFLRDLGVRH
jgi:hypothetical protein